MGQRASKTLRHQIAIKTALVLAAAAVFLVLFFIFRITEEKYVAIFPEKEKEITMIAVGDIMLDRGVEYSVMKNGSGDFKFLFSKIGDYLKGADILFGNLESMISDKGVNVGSIYSFRAEPKAMDGLVYAGFDIVSLANNHALDYTRLALLDTMSRLEENGILYVGAGKTEKEAFSFKVIEKRGVKIGFLAYNGFGPAVWRAQKDTAGIAWVGTPDLESVKTEVSAAKAASDILFVSFHAGTEYNSEPSEFQKYFYPKIIEAGADVVIGHHPHVAEPFEKYGNGWIAYSLGNFIFDQKFSKETMSGSLLEIKIKGKKIGGIIPKDVKINGDFQPQL